MCLYLRSVIVQYSALVMSVNYSKNQINEQTRAFHCLLSCFFVGHYRQTPSPILCAQKATCGLFLRGDQSMVRACGVYSEYGNLWLCGSRQAGQQQRNPQT